VSGAQPEGGWTHSAIEVNLRKGGTTHPFLTLKFLTDGTYDLEDGLFYAQSGRPKYYYSTDTVQSERYKGLRAEDLIDIAVYHGLHFHGPTERGVVFHLIGALSEFGKLGVVSIGDNLQQARLPLQAGAAGAGRGDGLPPGPVGRSPVALTLRPGGRPARSPAPPSASPPRSPSVAPRPPPRRPPSPPPPRRA
jgi:hypothetical protein